MSEKKMTKKEKQDIIRKEAVRLLNKGNAFNEPLLVGANEYAIRVDGAIIGKENQDCWVVAKLTVKNFDDTETLDAYDAYSEAEAYQMEVEQKAKEAAEKKAEKERKAAESKARREARKAKKEEEKEES